MDHQPEQDGQLHGLLLPPGKNRMIGHDEAGNLKQDGYSVFYKSTPNLPSIKGKPNASSRARSCRYVYSIGGKIVAGLQVMDAGVSEIPPVLANLYVAEDYRRQGLATKLYRIAKSHMPAMVFSEDLSDDGHAFVNAMNHTSQIQKDSLQAMMREIASIAIWQDTYPGGPDIMDGKWHITPKHVRLARKIISVSNVEKFGFNQDQLDFIRKIAEAKIRRDAYANGPDIMDTEFFLTPCEVCLAREYVKGLDGEHIPGAKP